MTTRHVSRFLAVMMLGLAVGLMAPVGVQTSLAQGIELADPATLTDEHKRLGARFAELIGANEFYVTPLNAMRRDIIRQVVSTNPDISEIVTEVTDQAYLDMAAQTGPLFAQIGQLYAQAYTLEELQELIAFFEAPLGAKFLVVRRPVDRAAVDLTITWGDTINAVFLGRVRALLAERGVEL